MYKFLLMALLQQKKKNSYIKNISKKPPVYIFHRIPLKILLFTHFKIKDRKSIWSSTAFSNTLWQKYLHNRSLRPYSGIADVGNKSVRLKWDSRGHVCWMSREVGEDGVGLSRRRTNGYSLRRYLYIHFKQALRCVLLKYLWKHTRNVYTVALLYIKWDQKATRRPIPVIKNVYNLLVISS